MVYRLFVEKKDGLQNEAKSLKSEINNLLQIKGLTNLRILNRYDVENIDKDLFDYCKTTVFSETAKGIEKRKVTTKDIEKIMDLFDGENYD